MSKDFTLFGIGLRLLEIKHLPLSIIGLLRDLLKLPVLVEISALLILKRGLIM